MPHFLELPVSLKTQVVSLQFKNVSLMNSEYLHLDFPHVPQTGATLNTSAGVPQSFHHFE